ncbi:unnamed protein product [Ilex paraguariensis]|uniref:Uncharacterized protein n=1 Tax=Ilex paraguariensis TaxID=185542 RepID=A0ABC8QR20_9AQUA
MKNLSENRGKWVGKARRYKTRLRSKYTGDSNRIPVTSVTTPKVVPLEVKSRAVKFAKLIENEDGVGNAVDTFHRHLPPELPLPAPSSVADDYPNPMQWLFIQIGKLCCLPCGSMVGFLQ